MRKLALKIRPKLVSINKKVERREKKREDKALKASRLTEAIEQELLNRLNSNVYGQEYDDILNVPQPAYEKVVDMVDDKEGLDQVPESELKEPEGFEASKEEIGRAVQQECRDRSRMPSSA
eukprot:TRINITY_DN20732_c0_g1_i1.p1 TRINITY_DN20732_c0_g1~~TRINITY_DN20732_c0_g1_i1.p1  ORF type:complete len:130 (-),score=29.02 TRINITY_DN20732_c0_g1_i1:10-372(-)